MMVVLGPDDRYLDIELIAYFEREVTTFRCGESTPRHEKEEPIPVDVIALCPYNTTAIIVRGPNRELETVRWDALSDVRRPI